jgi:trigger factor
MQITSETTGNLTATICIEIGKKDYAPRLDEKLKEYRKKVKMPGFREGKVPLGMVNKMYGKAILADEMNQIISEALANYLDEQKIETLASPLPNREKQEMIDFDIQEQFSFWFDIALRPEVNIQLESLQGIKRYQVEPEDAKTEDYLAYILKRHGSIVPTDVVDEDSMINCDLAQIPEGADWSGEPNVVTDKIVSIASIKNEEIKAKFLGAKEDEAIEANPMEAFENLAEVSSLLNIKREDLPENPGNYTFLIREIRKVAPAELTEELYQSVFPNDGIETQEAFRDRIAKDIRDSYAQHAETMMINSALDALIQGTQIELPDDFLKRWLLHNDEEGTMTRENVEEGYEEYANQLRTALIRSVLFETYDIRVTEEDMYNKVKNLLNMDDADEGSSEMNRMRLAGVMESVMKDKKQRENLSERILQDKLGLVMIEKVPCETIVVDCATFDQLNE